MATANYAIHLDSDSSQYWTISDDAAFDYATGNAFTFGLVFRLDYDYPKTTRTYLWSRQNQHEMYVESGELVYYFNGAGGAVTWRTGVRIVPQKTYFLCLTGSESTNTTLILYLDGKAKATKLVTGGMPADVATDLYFGIDYGTTAGYYFKGNMTGFFQSNTTALSAANVLISYNDGVYDIDTVEAITGLVDSIGFEENTGTTYDNALNAEIDGAGQNTPTWVRTVDPMQKHDFYGTSGPMKDFTGVGQSYYGPVVVHMATLDHVTAANKHVHLDDWAGNVVWHYQTSAQYDSANFVPATRPFLVHGIKIRTMDDGVLGVLTG